MLFNESAIVRQPDMFQIYPGAGNTLSGSIHGNGDVLSVECRFQDLDFLDLLIFSASRSLSAIGKTCFNGMSEMVSELSGGVATLCYNLVMMHYIGADGVSAIPIVAYVQFLALAAMIGYSNGIAPVMSYNHGAGDKKSMQHLLRSSVIILSVMSFFVFAMMEVFTDEIAGLFAESSESVMDITVRGARIFSIGFLFMGMNLYASSLFTSLSNGPVSAVIAAVRSVILLAPLIILLPEVFGIDAVWFAVPITEIVTLALSAFLLVKHNKDYGYFASKTTG